MGAETAIIESALCEITNRIWAHMLNSEVALVGHGHERKFVPELGAVVRVSGEWNGIIEILSSFIVGENIACRIFDIKVGDRVEASLVLDALKEFANITGGNLKTVLPEPCVLSIPEMLKSVSEPSPDNLVADLLFSSEQGILEVRVIRD